MDNAINCCPFSSKVKGNKYWQRSNLPWERVRHRLFPVENLLPRQLWWDLRLSTHNFIPSGDNWGQELVCHYQKVRLSLIVIIWAKITNNGYEYPCTVAVTKRKRRASIRILLWPDISIGNTGVHETSHPIVHHTLSWAVVTARDGVKWGDFDCQHTIIWT